MKKITTIASVFALLPITAFSASFDCAKAASPTEKLICSNGSISKLDEQLASAYKQALESSTDKDAVKKAQIEWLKQQRTCIDADCLIQAYRTRMVALTKAAAQSDDASSSFVPSKKNQINTFKVLKGQEYAVCQTFNDYLNRFYKKGDCFIRKVPENNRLLPVKMEKVSLLQYENTQILSRINGKDLTEQEKIKRSIKNKNDNGLHMLYRAEIDLDNDGAKENVLINFIYSSIESANKEYCDWVGGDLDLLVNNQVDNSKWDGPVSGFPIIFDGRTFLIFGGESVYQIYEPQALEKNEYRSGIDRQGDIKIKYICNLDKNS